MQRVDQEQGLSVRVPVDLDVDLPTQRSLLQVLRNYLVEGAANELASIVDVNILLDLRGKAQSWQVTGHRTAVLTLVPCSRGRCLNTP